jgi:hypothetical protein
MGTSRALGLLLIAVGAALLVVVTTGVGGEIVVVTVGVGFLVAYTATRSYGLLIPGAILTGLGMGIVIASQGGPDESVVLGLGAGFLAITVVDVIFGRPRGGWWWPLIPGGVLTIVGASTFAGIESVGRYVAPTLLIAVGILLLFRRRPVDEGPGVREATPQVTPFAEPDGAPGTGPTEPSAGPGAEPTELADGPSGAQHP